MHTFFTERFYVDTYRSARNSLVACDGESKKGLFLFSDEEETVVSSIHEIELSRSQTGIIMVVDTSIHHSTRHDRNFTLGEFFALHEWSLNGKDADFSVI